MKITIETIPHETQRYPTVGDWFYEPNGDLTIKVSELGDWRYNALVGLHELVEVLKCKYDGVTQEEVDKFDIAYEKTRPEDDDSEPGDSIDAPYRKQHCLATGVERILAAELGVDWKSYDDAVMNLP
jgi:hypothetical protein